MPEAAGMPQQTRGFGRKAWGQAPKPLSQTAAPSLHKRQAVGKPDLHLVAGFGLAAFCPVSALCALALADRRFKLLKWRGCLTARVRDALSYFRFDWDKFNHVLQQFQLLWSGLSLLRALEHPPLSLDGPRNLEPFFCLDVVGRWPRTSSEQNALLKMVAEAIGSRETTEYSWREEKADSCEFAFFCQDTDKVDKCRLRLLLLLSFDATPMDYVRQNPLQFAKIAFDGKRFFVDDLHSLAYRKSPCAHRGPIQALVWDTQKCDAIDFCITLLGRTRIFYEGLRLERWQNASQSFLLVLSTDAKKAAELLGVKYVYLSLTEHTLICYKGERWVEVYAIVELLSRPRTGRRHALDAAFQRVFAHL